VLADDILVEIFKFYIWDLLGTKWHTLVHVCRRWRYVVFGSPRYLDLEVEYTGMRPITEMPKVWQTLPIVMQHRGWGSCDEYMIAALDSFMVALAKFTAFMRKPFPELADLHLSPSKDNEMPVLPRSFLGGPAPHLRRLFRVRPISRSAETTFVCHQPRLSFPAVHPGFLAQFARRHGRLSVWID